MPIFYYTNLFVKLLPAFSPVSPDPEAVITPFLDEVPQLLKSNYKKKYNNNKLKKESLEKKRNVCCCFSLSCSFISNVLLLLLLLLQADEYTTLVQSLSLPFPLSAQETQEEGRKKLV